MVTAAQVTAAQVIAKAKSYIEYAEGPRDNENIFAPNVGHANFQPWCASFVCSVFNRLGALELIPNPSAYTPSMYQGFVNKGQQIDHRRPGLWKPGDIVFFKFPGINRISHVGILRASVDATHWATVEGNTNRAGSRTGGMVLGKSRNVSMIAGIGRPKYGSIAAAAKPAAPKIPARITYLRSLKNRSAHENHVIDVWVRTGKLLTPTHISRIINDLNHKRPISAHENHVFNVWVKEGKVIL